MIQTRETTALDAGDRPGGRVLDRHHDNESVDDNYPGDNYPVTTTTRPERSRIDS